MHLLPLTLLTAGPHTLGVRTVPADGVREWWVATDGGMEQGWTVEHGPASIAVIIEGAQVVAYDEIIELRLDDGARWEIRDLAAKDARGRALPVRLTPTKEGYRVDVDARGAVWPVEVDPVYTMATNTLFGPVESDFGLSLAGAGDVDADGYDDLIVGAPIADDVGAAFLYRGRATGYAATADTSLPGWATRDQFGYPVAPAGDVDGDGYDDVIVAVRGDASHIGGAAIYSGSAAGLSSTPTIVLTGWETGEPGRSCWGTAVRGTGDVNGDGWDDVLIGKPGTSYGGGNADLYFGAAAGINSVADASLSGAFQTAIFAHAVAGAGDVNGDGYVDAIVSAVTDSAGAGYVYEGGAAGLDDARVTALTIPDGHADYGYRGFGNAIAGGSDFDDDGFTDVVIAGYGYFAPDKTVHVYVGGASGVDSTPIVSLGGTGGERETTDFGFAVATAGDVNRDGFDDLIVGAFSANANLGGASVFLGGPAGLSDTADSDLIGTAARGFFGYAVAGAGDIDADGYDDVAVGAAYAGPGSVSLYRGYADTDGDGSAATADCDDTNAAVNGDAPEVCNGIDDNCDGLADEGVVPTWYADADGDGFGSASEATEACESPTGNVASATDCDDINMMINPSAVEVCDDSNTDENCDGLANDADPSVTGKTRWYVDGDGDGFGSASETRLACSTPTGFTDNHDDCDDADGAVHPNAAEIADNGSDDDCAGGDAGSVKAQDAPDECGCGVASGRSSAAGLFAGLGVLIQRRRCRKRH